MKKILSIIVLVIFTLPAYSQLDDILKKIPGTDILYTPAVTTSIEDAYPISGFINDVDSYEIKNDGEDFTSQLEPGYYHYTLKSYCLHAGTYGPYAGAGYLMAPLKGAKSDLIKKIMNRTEEHPEIDQKDAQLLIWGVEADMKFSDYPADFQARVAPLLKPEEIAAMQVDTKQIANDLMPQEIKDALNFYGDMRSKLADPVNKYDEIENIAVKVGVPPLGPGSKNYGPGNWSYVGKGVFIRTFPERYSKTNVEVYIPQQVDVKKDAKGRITNMQSGPRKVEFSYMDDLGADLIQGAGKLYSFARIKNITLTNLNTSESNTIDEQGNFVRYGIKGSGTPNVTRTDDPTPQQLTETDKVTDSYVSEVSDMLKSKKKPGKLKDSKANELKEIKSLLMSMKSLQAKNLGGEMMTGAVTMLYDYMNSTAVGSSKSSGGNKSANDVDITSFVSAPANTSAQRIGISPPKHPEKEKCKCNKTIEGLSSISQPTQRTCWAACTTMMKDWKDGTAYEIDTVVHNMGSYYVDLYNNDEVLPKSKVSDFLNVTGFVAEPNGLSLDKICDLLKTYGTLIILSDVAGPGEEMLLHMRVLYSAEGECKPENTTYKMMDPDPASSGNYSISATDLNAQISKYLAEASEGKYPWVIHFP